MTSKTQKIKELFDFDKNQNCIIIGTDEAGRGPGAGPVFAAAVYFPTVNDEILTALSLLNDSKKLSEKNREECFEQIIKYAVYSIQYATVEEIEYENILNASLNTMKKACNDVIKQIKQNNIKILVDGNKKIKNVNFNQETVVKGDGKSASIAAASILAKVSRDRLMIELDKEFPQYCWAKNKGYLTAEHIQGIKNFGATKWHRKKFIQNILSEQTEQLTLL